MNYGKNHTRTGFDGSPQMISDEETKWRDCVVADFKNLQERMNKQGMAIVVTLFVEIILMIVGIILVWSK